jgi:N-acyl-D-aspartate/D-glutamate deacylase
LRIARERRNVSLEEAVHKMTGAAASRFRLGRRGRIEEGYAGDVTVFDWEGIRDHKNATGDAPPSGVEYVFVNGKLLFDMGMVTAEPSAGQLLLSRSQG